MKLVAVLLVKNEADIIRANLDWHFGHGVDFAVVTDNGSTDGTLEILNQYARGGRVKVIRNLEPFYQSRMTTEMAFIARNEFAADWILPADADELWSPDGPTLKGEIARAEGNVISVPTVNFVPTEQDDCREQNPVYRMRYKGAHRPHLSRISRIYARSKVMFKAADVIRVHEGNHRVVMTRPRETRTAFVRIHHYPVRSHEQFIRKVLAGTPAVQNNPYINPTVAYHWREWYAAYQHGRIDDEWNRLRLGRRRLRMLNLFGIVEYDDRIARRLEQLRASADAPHVREVAAGGDAPVEVFRVCSARIDWPGHPSRDA